MHLIKPSWILHTDESRPTRPDLTIYSLDIHPDGSRLATGGLDSVVRVWSTLPVLSPDAEQDPRCPRLLSTLQSHTGGVMSVRWNHSGSSLASGSDDRIVVIWQHEGSGGGKVLGSETTNIENWKQHKLLVGHQSDVTGIDWSPHDEYIASSGLDNDVLIWSGHNFQLLHKLSGHLNFVKGLVFDPAGQFLATQADDNSMKIWRCDSWTLHADVQEPFDDAPKAGIMRPTWSPDGAYVVAPNSMNGPVFCAGVIQRRDWTSPASLVGHPDIVQASAYNPLLFLRDDTKPVSLDNSCSLLALCAQGTVSLWFTDRDHPLLVLADVMDREVLDMRWSKDGTQLWLSSSEGHVACLTFSLSEYAAVAPAGSQAQLFFEEYGVTPRAKAPSRPPSAQSSSSALGGAAAAQPNALVARKGPNAKRPRIAQLSTQPFAPAQPSPLQQTMQPNVGALPPLKGQVAPVQQQLQAAGNPFANAPTFAAPAPAAAVSSNAFASTSTAQLPPQHGFGGAPSPFVNDLTASKKRKATADPAGTIPQQQQQPLYAPYVLPPGFGPPPTLLPPGYPAPPPGYPLPPPGYAYPAPLPLAAAQLQPPPPPPQGYVGSPYTSTADYRLQGHTLSRSSSEGQGLEAQAKRELAPAYAPYDREATFRVTHRVAGRSSSNGKGKGREEDEGLAVPAVMSAGRYRLEDGGNGDVLEWRNFSEGERKGEAEIMVLNAKNKKSVWVDYVPRYVVAATGSPEFSAVSLEDGSLIAWSPSGRRLIPTLVLDSPCSFLEAEGSFLLAITALGKLTVWNLSTSIPKPRSIYPPLNISTLLSASSTRSHPSPRITTSALLPSGTPLLALSTGSTFSYDADLSAWTRVSEPYWAKKSDAWEGRRGRGQGVKDQNGRGIIRTIEGAVNEIVVNAAADGGDEDDESDDDSVQMEESGKKGGDDVEMNGGTASTDAKNGDNGASSEVTLSSSSNTPNPRPPKRALPSGAASTPTASSSDYRTAVSLAHFETRLSAAIALDSPSEYKAFLVQYAKRLAEEGLRSKAEELVRELLGPVYHKPGTSGADAWSPTVLGFNKRDLLRDVLRELGKSRTTDALAKEYIEILRKVTAPW